MPTYEFACPSGHRFDHFVRKISESVAELPCPECGATATRQLSAGAGLIFKGSGFYITDYGKDGKKSPVAPASTGEKSDGAKPKAGDAGVDKGAAPDSKESSTGSASDKSSGSGGNSSSGGRSGDKSTGGGSSRGSTSKE